MLEFGKLLFGRQRFTVPPGGRIVFTESEVCLPDRAIPYEDVFYRHSDTLVFQAQRLELVDRCYADRRVMEMGWLDAEERLSAEVLAGSAA